MNNNRCEHPVKNVSQKISIVLCMLVTMVFLYLPLPWYRREVANNEAYGYENMDSFNYIPECLAQIHVPLVAGIPLCLLYLLCLKRKQRRLTIVLIAIAPFIPWIVYDAFFIDMPLGVLLFFLLISFIFPIFYMGLAFLNTEFLIYCSWDGSKKPLIEFLIFGYVVVFLIGVLMTTSMF